MLLSACAPNRLITNQGPFPCSQIDEVVKRFEALVAEVHKKDSEKNVLVSELKKYQLDFLTKRNYAINLEANELARDGEPGEHLLGKDAVKAAYAFEVHMDGPITLGGKTVRPEDFGRVEVFRPTSICIKEISYDDPIPRLFLENPDEGFVSRTTTFFLSTLDGYILTAELKESFKKDVRTYEVPIILKPFVLIGKIISSAFMGAPTNPLSPAPFN